VDGSEAAAGILYDAVDASAADAEGVAIVRLAEVKQAVDQQFARWVMLHVQSNPLPICTRPRVLITCAPDDGVPAHGGRHVRRVRDRCHLHAGGW
jgi:hypothetical protein